VGRLTAKCDDHRLFPEKLIRLHAGPKKHLDAPAQPVIALARLCQVGGSLLRSKFERCVKNGFVWVVHG
jgi:hypothetical protein